MPVLQQKMEVLETPSGIPCSTKSWQPLHTAQDACRLSFFTHHSCNSQCGVCYGILEGWGAVGGPQCRGSAKPSGLGSCHTVTYCSFSWQTQCMGTTGVGLIPPIQHTDHPHFPQCSPHNPLTIATRLAAPGLEWNYHLLPQKPQNMSQLVTWEESDPILDARLCAQWIDPLVPAALSNHVGRSSTYYANSPDMSSAPKEASYIQIYYPESQTPSTSASRRFIIIFS